MGHETCLNSAVHDKALRFGFLGSVSLRVVVRLRRVVGVGGLSGLFFLLVVVWCCVGPLTQLTTFQRSLDIHTHTA